MASRILAGVLIVAALLGLLLYSQWRGEPVKVSGFIEADEIRVGSRIGGRVVEVKVVEGQQVHAGDVLLRLDEFDLNARLAEAEANLAAKQAELQKLQNGYRPEEIAQAKAHTDALAANLKKLVDGPRPEEIEVARAQLQLARSQLERASRSLERTQSLFAQRSASQDELDRAVEEFRVAEATQQARQEELQLLEKGSRAEDIAAAQAQLDQATQAYHLVKHGYRQEEIEQAQATVDAAKAAIDALHVQQRELSIKADVDGIVSAMELRPGDLVAPNGPVLSLTDMAHLWVRAYVPENRLDLQVGQKFEVTVDSFPDRTFQGEVTFIAPQAEFTPRNIQTPEERSKQVFRIKVSLLEGLDVLRPGMAADVWLEPQ